MHDLESVFLEAITKGMSTRTLTTCSRWSAKRRIMGGDFPGNYGWKYHPWVQEILDSTTPFNYAMKGAQLGVTEVAINRAFYTLDRNIVTCFTSCRRRSMPGTSARPASARPCKQPVYQVDLHGHERGQSEAGRSQTPLHPRKPRQSNLKSIPVSS